MSDENDSVFLVAMEARYGLVGYVFLTSSRQIKWVRDPDSAAHYTEAEARKIMESLRYGTRIIMDLETAKGHYEEFCEECFQ